MLLNTPSGKVKLSCEVLLLLLLMPFREGFAWAEVEPAIFKFMSRLFKKLVAEINAEIPGGVKRILEINEYIEVVYRAGIRAIPKPSTLENVFFWRYSKNFKSTQMMLITCFLLLRQFAEKLKGVFKTAGVVSSIWDSFHEEIRTYFEEGLQTIQG
eukprot:TRINITY_DN6300_c0_g1_i1.p1 TRINITY_DN6300_c0_g1~~TRINITY_DN6300_c0_g1_i1.p1  ORF type:complete len:156 (+),score=32.54 TRINITY_DN6300_c0_g1_i1:88-555(+)